MLPADRPAYQARGGYAGMRLTARISHRLGHYVITVFARGRYYGGAVFRYSPLLTARMTVLAGVCVGVDICDDKPRCLIAFSRSSVYGAANRV